MSIHNTTLTAPRDTTINLAFTKKPRYNQISMGDILARPFLKWVGGKTRLLPQFSTYFPAHYNRYFEPFLGGGAAYFHLRPHNAVLNDINPNLILAYKNIRNNPENIIQILGHLEREYRQLEPEDQKSFFYEQRELFNQLAPSEVTKTALLIFLNKTCFNGLYRENSKGYFNVPFGKYHNPTICDEQNLISVAKLLSGSEILNLPFSQAVAAASAGDFVYLDPPYYPINATSSFTSYSQDNFDKDDQIQLKETVDTLSKKGCLVMLSNSDTQFIKELYKDYRQETVLAGRTINSIATKRGKITELVVLNY